MSILPSSTPNSQMAVVQIKNQYQSRKRKQSDLLPRVSIKARVGSPDADKTEKGFRIGTKLSLEMAYNKRGAEIKLCNPAPVVARKEPIKIAHSLGQAKLATTKRPPILTPNLPP